MRRILLIMTILTTAVAAMAQRPFWWNIQQSPAATIRRLPPAPPKSLPDSISIGFITCYPGPEIFELYGHEAVRVSGRLNNTPIDFVFNYGLFDFDSSGFVYRFLKGETDYQIGCDSLTSFLYQYKERGSKVVERVLPLTQDEALAMYRALWADVQPDANTYRYKYFTANCATKPLDHLNRITDGRFRPTSSGDTFTLRDLLRQYNEGYPWYQLGIDLVLGSMLDRPAQAAQAAFIPIELDARCFGSLPERVLVEGVGDGNQRGEPTPLPLTPLFLFWAIFAVIAFYILRGRFLRRTSSKPCEKWSKTDKAVCSVWFGMQGVAGLLVWFLTFCSEHEGTAPNFNVVWLNPLWLAIPCMIWSSRCQRATTYVMTADVIVSVLFLAAIPCIPQCMNPAVIPMLLTTLLLALRPTLLKSNATNI